MCHESQSFQVPEQIRKDLLITRYNLVSPPFQIHKPLGKQVFLISKLSLGFTSVADQAPVCTFQSQAQERIVKIMSINFL